VACRAGADVGCYFLAANAFARTYWVAVALVGVTIVAATFLPSKLEQSHRLDDEKSEAAPVVVH
jgi:hypothetical protein